MLKNWTNLASLECCYLSINEQSMILSDLHGVEVIGHTTVVVAYLYQSFNWSGYGFKLYPPSTMPQTRC